MLRPKISKPKSHYNLETLLKSLLIVSSRVNFGKTYCLFWNKRKTPFVKMMNIFLPFLYFWAKVYAEVNLFHNFRLKMALMNESFEYLINTSNSYEEYFSRKKSRQFLIRENAVLLRNNIELFLVSFFQQLFDVGTLVLDVKLFLKKFEVLEVLTQ